MHSKLQREELQDSEERAKMNEGRRQRGLTPLEFFAPFELLLSLPERGDLECLSLLLDRLLLALEEVGGLGDTAGGIALELPLLPFPE